MKFLLCAAALLALQGCILSSNIRQSCEGKCELVMERSGSAEF